MPQHDDDSFKNMNVKAKTATIIGFTLFIMLILSFVLGMFFFGFAGVFELLGVYYQSIWSLVIFVVSYFILGFFVDLFFGSVAALSVQNITEDVKAFVIQVIFGFVSNWIVLVTVDTLMESIILSQQTKLMLALLLGMLDAVFDNKKKK